MLGALVWGCRDPGPPRRPEAPEPAPEESSPAVAWGDTGAEPEPPEAVARVFDTGFGRCERPPRVDGTFERPSPDAFCPVSAPAGGWAPRRVAAGEVGLLRIAGGEWDGCHDGLPLRDNDGDGVPELLVVCDGDPYPRNRGPFGLWVFRGDARGHLGPEDATTRVVGPWAGRNHVAVGRFGPGGTRALAASDSREAIRVFPLPLPPGEHAWDELVAVAEIRHDGKGELRLATGDVDGDGFDDLTLSGVHPDGREGGLAVLRGPLAGTIDAERDAWATFEAGDYDTLLAKSRPDYSGGYGLGVLGDLDCDGRADVVLPGNHLADVRPSRDGYVRAHGGLVPFGVRPRGGAHHAADARAVLYGACQGSPGLTKPVPVGDVTGDGLRDVALPADRADMAGHEAGAVYVVSGLTGQHGFQDLVGDAAAVLFGEGRDDHLDQAGRIGDLDGDGVDDLVVSARDRKNGRIYLFFGPVTGLRSVGEADLAIDGAPEEDTFGGTLKSAGDLDDDGIPDLLVGSPTAAFGGSRSEGAVRVLSGRRLLEAAGRPEAGRATRPAP